MSFNSSHYDEMCNLENKNSVQEILYPSANSTSNKPKNLVSSELYKNSKKLQKLKFGILDMQSKINKKEMRGVENSHTKRGMESALNFVMLQIESIEKGEIPSMKYSDYF